MLGTNYRPHTLTQAKRFAEVSLAKLPTYLEYIGLDDAALPFRVIRGLLVSPGRDACMIEWAEDTFTPKQREQLDEVVGDDNALRRRYSEAD